MLFFVFCFYFRAGFGGPTRHFYNPSFFFLQFLLMDGQLGSPPWGGLILRGPFLLAGQSVPPRLRQTIGGTGQPVLTSLVLVVWDLLLVLKDKSIHIRGVELLIGVTG